MKSSVHPIWWPTLASLSLVLLPLLAQKTRAFHRIRREAAEENLQRISQAGLLALSSQAPLVYRLICDSDSRIFPGSPLISGNHHSPPKKLQETAAKIFQAVSIFSCTTAASVCHIQKSR